MQHLPTSTNAKLNPTTIEYLCVTIMEATKSQASSAFTIYDTLFSTEFIHSQELVRLHVALALQPLIAYK